jgi:hypothetical protein
LRILQAQSRIGDYGLPFSALEEYCNSDHDATTEGVASIVGSSDGRSAGSADEHSKEVWREEVQNV